MSFVLYTLNMYCMYSRCISIEHFANIGFYRVIGLFHPLERESCITFTKFSAQKFRRYQPRYYYKSDILIGKRVYNMICS